MNVVKIVEWVCVGDCWKCCFKGGALFSNIFENDPPLF